MQVTIWGVRGSLPTPMGQEQFRRKLEAILAQATPADLASAESRSAFLDRCSAVRTYGGNTSCVEVALENATLICDAGSGIRGLSDRLFADGRGVDHPLHVLFTHFHWDHLCGLPFFGPIYVPQRKLDFWSWRTAEDIDRLLGLQMADAHFPVKWPDLPSRRSCHHIDVDTVTDIAGASVRCLEMVHPDGAYGYRIDHGGHAVCYLTDTEVSRDPAAYQQQYADFVEGADLVIVDSMYGFLQYHEHYDFGHSSIFTWIDFFKQSTIGELLIFHHDPQAADEDLEQLGDSAQRYLELIAPEASWKLGLAHEGLTRQLG